MEPHLAGRGDEGCSGGGRTSTCPSSPGCCPARTRDIRTATTSSGTLRSSPTDSSRIFRYSGSSKNLRLPVPSPRTRHGPPRPALLLPAYLSLTLLLLLPMLVASAAPAKSTKNPLLPKKKTGPLPSKKKTGPLPSTKKTGPLPSTRKTGPLPSTKKTGPSRGAAPSLPGAAVNRTQLAQQHVVKMTTYLAKLGNFKIFLAKFAAYGLDTMVSTWLPQYNVTILAPDDKAFKAQAPADRAMIGARKNGWLQVLAFHIWFPRSTVYDNARLSKVGPGRTFSTGCYPQKGIMAYSLNTRPTRFNGRLTDTWGASLGKTVYYDATAPNFPIISVIQVDAIMIPLRFY